MTASSTKRTSERITYRRLLVFFLPLAATPFMIASTHTIANSVMARLPYPVLSLAIFSVVQAMTNTLKSPVLLAKEVTVSLVDSDHSLRIVRRFYMGLALLLAGFLITLGYTPAGGWFFTHVMGLTDPESVAFAYAAMRIACFLPFVEIYRNFFQGMAIAVRRTGIVSLGTGFRLVVILLIALWSVQTQSLPGVIVAAMMWTVGIGLEGLFLSGLFLRRLGSPSQVVRQMPQRSKTVLTYAQILTFFLPLAAMMIMNTSLQPFIQGLVARSPVSPTESLASYGVAWGLFLIISGPLNMLHQCALVFARKPRGRDWETVRRFSLAAGFVVSSILAIVALTPLGYWIMRTLIGVSPEIASLSRWVLLSFTLYPALRAWQELYWGLLLGARKTSIISFGKVLNLATALLVLTLLVSNTALAALIPAAVAGGIGFSVGQGVESVFLWQYAKRRVTAELFE